jgi:hypothetical protein
MQRSFLTRSTGEKQTETAGLAQACSAKAFKTWNQGAGFMSFSRAFFVLAAAAWAAPAAAEPACKLGDICVIQSPLFGCKEPALIQRWIELYVEQDRETAERFITDQAAAGQCARFATGDRLVLLRYLGMRRLEARRPGESQSFILLLK